MFDTIIKLLDEYGWSEWCPSDIEWHYRYGAVSVDLMWTTGAVVIFRTGDDFSLTFFSETAAISFLESNGMLY